MKKRPLFLPLLTLGALAALVLALVWFISGDNSHPASVAREQGNRLAGSSGPDRPQSRAGQPEHGAESVAAPAQAVSRPPAPPAGVDPFAPALSDAELLRTERRMFQAQTWEVDLGKALDLRPGERLERRSGLFRLAGGGGLVRLDRVYRLGGVRPAVAAKTAVQGSPASAPALAAAVDPTGPLDAGGGELVWANAMVADHLMVQVESGVTRERLAAALPRQAHVGKQVTAGGLYLVEVPVEGERSVERAVLALNQIKGVVKFAEPDFVLTGADTTPNDPLFTANAADLSKQWHLAKIRAPRAWDVLTGPPFPPDHPQYQPRLAETVVAVVDTGIDFTHPDLMSRMWTNIGETGGGKETNNADDDGNGKIDDWQGWDFIDNDKNPMDDVGHGTHVAGIIGAVGNNATGGSGVCWNVKLINLRIIKAQGTGTYGTYSGAIGALDYIRVLNTTGRRVAVANHSWGGRGYSLPMLNAINNPRNTSAPLPVGITSTFGYNVNTLTAAGTAGEIAKIIVGMSISGAGIPAGTLVTIVSGSTITLSDYTTMAGTGAALTFSNPFLARPYGVVHVAAAGNSSSNSDRVPTYPASLPSGFVISVGATDSADAVASWGLVQPPTGSPYVAASNYGHKTVDIFAPGSSIWSTKMNGGYESRNGTSMAAPQVAGALALVRMWQPNLTELQARQVVIEQAEALPSLQTKCASSGRLNIAKIIDRLYAPVLVGSGGGTSGGGTSAELLQASMAVTGRIAFGSGGHVLLLDNGDVWSWGKNNTRQLGRSVGDYAPPGKIAGLSDVVMVAAASDSSFALKADGSVWFWGANRGLLGDGTTTGTYFDPTKIAALSDIVWLSVDSSYCLAVRADGRVLAWGSNFAKQLGDGTTTNRYTPVEVMGVSDVIQVSAGSIHALALRRDGTVYAWGSPNIGNGSSLGNGMTNGSADPFVISSLSGVQSVAAGGGYSLFMMADGTVRLTGAFSSYWPEKRLTPTPVAGLAKIRFVAAGRTHALALDEDGRLFAWGSGASGCLGTASEESQTVPVEVPRPDGAGIVACSASNEISGLLADDGKLWFSGTNATGGLGHGTSRQKTIAVRMDRLQNVADLGSTSGEGCSWAIQTDGTCLRWGVVDYDLVSGFPIASQFPKVFTIPGKQIRMMASNPLLNGGVGNFFALTVDGLVYSWGQGNGGLGDGSTGSRGIPTLIPGLTGVSRITSNSSHTLAVKSDGTLRGWGDNYYGQIGNGTLVDQPTPVAVTGLPSVVDVKCTFNTSYALCADGSVWAWGNNTYGQLGDGTFTNSSVPRKIAALSGIVQIAVDYADGCLALKADGTVFGWGRSDQKHLAAMDASGKKATPSVVLAASIPKITALGITNPAATALREDGRVISWGSSYLGQYPTIAQPGLVFGATDVVELCATHFRKADGSVWTWGQIGLGIGDEWSSQFIEPLVVNGESSSLFSLGTGNLGDSWYFQNFSSSEVLSENVSGDAADPDRDGIANLLEYALGLNPREANDAASLPTPRIDFVGAGAQSESTGAVIGDGQISLFSLPTVDLISGKHYMALTAERHGGIRLDIDYIVEVSPDLQSWQSGDPHTVTVLDTVETLEVYDATAIEDAPHRFMRMKIQRK